MLPGSGNGSRNVQISGATHDPCQGPTSAEWEEIKDAVEHFYVTNKRPLKDVRAILKREYNFRATERMYKTRLSQWGFAKNARGEDYRALAALHRTRKDSAGKPATEFLVRGRKKTIADLRAYIRSKNLSEEDFLAQAEGFTIPPHIQCYIPDPNGTKTSPSHSPEDRPVPSPLLSSDGLHLTPSSSGSCSSPPDSSLRVRRPSGTNFGFLAPEKSPIGQGRPYRPRGTQDMAIEDDFVLVPGFAKPRSETSSSSPCSCDQIQQDVRTMALQVVRPAALMSRYGAEDIQSWVLLSPGVDAGSLCPKCNEPMGNHPAGLEGLAPSVRESRSLLIDCAQDAMTVPSTTECSGEAWRWLAYCFGACIYMCRGQSHLSKLHLEGAAGEFREMLKKRDPLILTSLNLMLAVLHTHNQGAISKTILLSSLNVAQHDLLRHDPIRITVEWMTTVAGLNLQPTGHNGEVLEQLKRVQRALAHDLGTENLSTIAALFNLGWMLLFEDRFAEAEEALRQTYAASTHRLGSMHMQSITALCTLARLQSSQGHNDAAVESYQTAIRDCEPTLGSNHPHRLESMRRLAKIYGEMGQKELKLELYWTVLRGRIMMLGASHPWTLGARRDLIALLKELDKWNSDGSTEWQINLLFERTVPTFPHESY